MDIKQNLVQSYTYDAFGAALGDSKDPNNYRYVGAGDVYSDDDASMQYMVNRWYDPNLGRFISRDPIGLNGGLNLYEYVNEDVLNQVDPLGLWTFSIGLSTSGGGGVAGTSGFGIVIGTGGIGFYSNVGGGGMAGVGGGVSLPIGISPHGSVETGTTTDIVAGASGELGVGIGGDVTSSSNGDTTYSVSPGVGIKGSLVTGVEEHVLVTQTSTINLLDVAGELLGIGNQTAPSGSQNSTSNSQYTSPTGK